MKKHEIVKKRFLLLSICLLLIGVFTLSVTAQTKRRTKPRGKARSHHSTRGSSRKKKKPAALVDTAKKQAFSDTTANGTWGSIPDSAVTDGAYIPKDFLNNKPTPYPNLREADVAYRKRVWREIDVRQKANKFLIYPKSSLFDVLVDHIKAGELTAYKVVEDGAKSDGDDFKKPFKSLSEFNTIFGGGKETIQVADMNNPGVMRDSVIEKTFNADSNVVAFRIKEDWIFDKQRSVFEPRILGLAPVIVQRNTAGEVIGTRVIFWVYYPEARNVLAHVQVFNTRNDATNLSYDDVFIKRMFSSYIIKVSNSEDLPFKKYPGVKSDIQALEEGDKAKNDLMNYESDLWDY